MSQYTSEGFDLDAATDDTVVLEIGGGVSQLQFQEKEGPSNNDDAHAEQQDDPLAAAEGLKRRGNECFVAKEYSQAYDYYTQAIEATPGMTGEQLLELQSAWQDEQERNWRQKLAQQEDERRTNKRRSEEKQGTATASSSSSDAPLDNTSSSSSNNHSERPTEKEVFVAPPHPHADALSVYHCNRAAASLHLRNWDRAIGDCSLALLWNPRYTKARVRRSQAYEQVDKTDLALQDAKAALELEATPQNRAAVKRLQKLEDERLEKLKTETLDKLKDLGNSILGNFGLSLDNFKAVQDPNTGSYSISFDQKK